MNDSERLHKALKNSLIVLNTIINELDLPKQVSKNSLNIYKLLIAKRLTRGRNRNELISACVYTVSQAANYPIDLNKLCKTSDSDKKGIIRQQKFIKRFIELKNNITPEQYMAKYSHELGLDEATKTKALKDLPKINNTKPEIIAATSIYLNSDKSIRKIARVTGLSKNAISANIKKVRVNEKLHA